MVKGKLPHDASQVTCVASLKIHFNSAEYSLRFPHFPFLGAYRGLQMLVYGEQLKWNTVGEKHAVLHVCLSWCQRTDMVFTCLFIKLEVTRCYQLKWKMITTVFYCFIFFTWVMKGHFLKRYSSTKWWKSSALRWNTTKNVRRKNKVEGACWQKVILII